MKPKSCPAGAGFVLGLMLIPLFAARAQAGLIASTSLEQSEGYPPGMDIRTPTYSSLFEPGDWGGDTFSGSKGGDAYTSARAEGPGAAYAGEQFFMMQRDGWDSDGDIVIRRKFPVQTGLLYYRWAFRIDSTATQPDYWQVDNNVNFTIDRKIDDAHDGTDSHVGTETFRIELHEDGRITVKQSSFGGDVTLTRKWDGTTTDGGPPVTSALNNWVKVEVLADISAQRFWWFWDGAYLGTYRFRKDLTSSGGIRQVNMIRFQCPRLDLAARGERLRVDDIELRTDPPAALSACLTAVSPGDVTANADAGQPAVPPTIDYTVHNFGPSSINWTATVLDETQNPAPVSWLSLTDTQGAIGTMGTATTTAVIDTNGVPGGSHVAYVKFVDDCSPVNEVIRRIRLVVTGCTWTVSSCNQVRSYLLDYPDMPVADVAYRVTNTGQEPASYTVATSGGSCLSGLWTLTNGTATVDPGAYVDVVATFHREALEGQPTDASYTCDLLFADNCSAQTIGRTIRLRYLGTGQTCVFRYQGDVDPLTDDSSGPGIRCDLYRESGLSALGSVQDDPGAYDGKVWRIQDDETVKTKYRFILTDSSGPIEMAGEIGATIVARVKVRSQAGSREGGLFLWEEDAGTCTYHWGGPDGLIQEVDRGHSATVPGTTDFVILRMTTVGRKDAPWACSRIVRLYFNESPIPVVELVGSEEEASEYEGFGFGAGSTSGTYDIAFDWVSGTNAGAFAPGQEEAVLGCSLVGTGCPADWADFDGDHDVDQADFGLWQSCVTGPGDPYDWFNAASCGCADYDRDEDVDVNDAGAFADCATGPGVLFDPANPPAGCRQGSVGTAEGTCK